MDERVTWVKAAIKQLDQLASEDEKYNILSRCAHEFSQKRIATLKAIYEHTKDVDSVLQEMRKDPPWYEDPVRKGNIIYVEKVPYNKEGYEKADNDDDKKMNYCHCPLIRKYLNEGISPTYCYCGSGWYRQLWEGIVGKPVKVDIVKSLLKGDSTCQFAIYLPVDV